MSKPIIILDAGHDGIDSGVSGNRIKEKDITLSVMKKVRALLKGKATVLVTRNSDIYMDLFYRSKIANDSGTIIFVSIHVNSATNKSAHGVETFSFNNASNNKGPNLTKAIQAELVKAKIFRSNRGTKKANFYVLRETTMPAALTELGFISNAQDAKILKTKQNKTKSPRQLLKVS